jgi:hypothetical protein
VMFGGGCSEKSSKAAEVLKEKMEDKLVAAAGEAEVSQKLLRQQYADLKEQFVKIKTMRGSFEREAAEAKANAERLRGEGKDEQARVSDRRAAMYAGKLEFLRQREMEAEAALREYAASYEEQKANLELLQEEINMYRATAGVTGNEIDSKLEERSETIKQLERTMKNQAERAKAVLEVGDIERTFKP